MKLATLSRYLLISSIGMNVFLLQAAQPLKKDKKPMNESKSAVSAKIAIVDLRRIVTQDPALLVTASDEWRDLYNKFQETMRPIAQDFAELQEKYKKKISELESLQKSGISSRENLKKKYEEEVMPLEYQMQNQDQQLRRFEYEELGKAQSAVAPKIEKAIDEVCAAQGWDFALNREAVPSRNLNKRFDITDDVLAALNKQYAAQKAEAKKKEESKKA